MKFIEELSIGIILLQDLLTTSIATLQEAVDALLDNGTSISYTNRVVMSF